MRAVTLVVRSFRNLADAEFELPPAGVALVGLNGHGKTNLIEALAYPVLLRSLRGARDRDVVRFGGPGFHVGLDRDEGPSIKITYAAETARKTVLIDGAEQRTVTEALGHWLAVAFLPTDIAIVQGGAMERRKWLDRLLSLADRHYLSGLLRYRAALAQRNAALRLGDVAAAAAFEPALAHYGAAITAARLAWVEAAVSGWRAELDTLGEAGEVDLRYRGDDALTDPAAWPGRLEATRRRDLQRGQTHVGPQRDDLVLTLDGRALRAYGSTGQHRAAAIALRLLELETIRRERSAEPALLVDDVFAALDGDRQARLASRLMRGQAQRVVAAPRAASLPAELDLPRWSVDHGVVRGDG
ncbi:MAG: DNA replication and repair protein RecF [Gemmatimonadales bacterium]